jgi:ribonucleotide reductase beta subunit family protein with ferritin-like domain
MEMADKWNRHEIVVDEDMIAFVEVPSNQKQFFHDVVHQAIFLDVVLVFLRKTPRQ